MFKLSDKELELLSSLESLLLSPSQCIAVQDSAGNDEKLKKLLKFIDYTKSVDIYRGIKAIDEYFFGKSVLLTNVTIRDNKELYDYLSEACYQTLENDVDFLGQVYLLTATIFMLNIFVRANWLGPPLSITLEADKCLSEKLKNSSILRKSDSSGTIRAGDLSSPAERSHSRLSELPGDHCTEEEALGSGGNLFNALDSLNSLESNTALSAYILDSLSNEFNELCILKSPDLKFMDVLDDDFRVLLQSIMNDLIIDGVSIYPGVCGLSYFYSCLSFLSVLTNANSSKMSCNLKTVFIWQSRIAFVWQRITNNSLFSPCPTLFDISTIQLITLLKGLKVLGNDFSIYDGLKGATADIGDFLRVSNSSLASKVITSIDIKLPSECKDELKAFLLLELIQRLPYYSLSRLYDALLEILNDIVGFEFHFTGKLGIRRKYQTKHIPQLTVDVKNVNGKNLSASPEVSPLFNPDAPGDQFSKSDTVPEGIGEVEDVGQPQDTTAPTSGISNILLSSLDDTIDILEAPKLDDPTGVRLSPMEQLILISKGLNIISKIPEGDELALEYVGAIASICLSSNTKETNWLIMSMILWLRCKTEYYRTKTIERATLQLHSLSDSYYEPNSSCSRRIQYFWFVNYPTSWDIKREIAMRICSIGSFLTAYEIYKQLHLWEDAIQCLIISDRKVDARKMIYEQLQLNGTPLLWCYLGDLDDDINHYIKAWELSNGKCVRAQRSLGRFYYKKNEYTKAIESFERAIAINPMNESSQFILGCCYLKTGNLKASITAFARVVSLNPESTDAWANMATAHINVSYGMKRRYAMLARAASAILKNTGAAKVCIEQSIKRDPTRWQLWDILLRISVSIIRAWKGNRFLKISLFLQKANIETWMVTFIVEYGSKNLDPSIIEDILKNITKEITDSSEIWYLYSKFKSFKKEYELALEFTFKEYRCIETEILKNLQVKRDTEELQLEHDKAQLKRLMNCFGAMVMLLKRLSPKSRLEKKASVITTLESIKSRIVTRTPKLNDEFGKEIDLLIENADVEDIICIER